MNILIKNQHQLEMYNYASQKNGGITMEAKKIEKQETAEGQEVNVEKNTIRMKKMNRYEKKLWLINNYMKSQDYNLKSVKSKVIWILLTSYGKNYKVQDITQKQMAKLICAKEINVAQSISLLKHAKLVKPDRKMSVRNIYDITKLIKHMEDKYNNG